MLKTYREPLAVPRAAPRASAHARGCAVGSDPPLRREDPRARRRPCATSPAATSRSSCSGASSRASRASSSSPQPTRGLDVGAIETVHAYLREAAATGVAILLISEDLDEILALADRILVMYEGEIVGELDAGHGDRSRRSACSWPEATRG